MILSLACMLLPISAFADEVKGIVADQTGLPVTGAFVLQKGTSNGTVTDLDGQFSIDVPSNAVLEVSCMGYVTQEISVAGRAMINVVLAEDNQLLEEVIVVGYGTTKKENLTGAVSVVSSESIQSVLTLTSDRSSRVQCQV
jgi:hypothetical protein